MADKAPRKLTLLEKIKRVGSWEECRDLCHDNTQCEYFQYKVGSSYKMAAYNVHINRTTGTGRRGSVC